MIGGRKDWHTPQESACASFLHGILVLAFSVRHCGSRLGHIELPQPLGLNESISPGLVLFVFTNFSYWEKNIISFVSVFLPLGLCIRSISSNFYFVHCVAFQPPPLPRCTLRPDSSLLCSHRCGHALWCCPVMYNNTGFLIHSTVDLLNRTSFILFVQFLFLSFNFRPLISASLIPHVFRWMDSLLKSLIDIHNGCLMNVFKEECTAWMGC